MTTAVLLCSDGLPDDLALGDPRLMPGLCAQPEPIRELASGADALVLGLCGREHSLGVVQREVRRAGLDPLGVEILDLRDANGDVARLEVLIAGATARAEAFPGSGPENAKLAMPSQTSRRALLTLAVPEYHAAPSIDPEVCAAERGCSACADVCPQKALSLTNGRVVHDRSVCEPCGRCVAACPTGAVTNPAVHPAALAAQVGALLDPGVGAAGPRGIVFRCRRGDHPETSDGWYPVTVPCTGMVTPSWFLAPLALGAGAVAALPCEATGCSLGQDDALSAATAWCHEFLGGAGMAATRVAAAPRAATLEAPIPAVRPADPFAPLAAASVLQALADAAGASPALKGRSGPGVRVAGTGSPLGIVDIDPITCTGCATCVASCPAGALTASGDGGTRTLTFDHGRCVACGTCVSRCPEGERGAITLTSAVDTARLDAAEVVWEGRVAVCESCGAPIATEALLGRIAGLLGDDGAVLTTVSHYCSNCRGLRL